MCCAMHEIPPTAAYLAQPVVVLTPVQLKLRGGFRLAAPMTAAQNTVREKKLGEKVRDGIAFFVLSLFSCAACSRNAVRNLP